MIEIKELVKSFGNVKAVDNVSLNIPQKTIFGFIGPDGAGKTTIFRIISSLLLPDKGFVRVDGFDPVKEYKEIRKFLGYMAGRFSLYQDLTVEENLKFYATIFGTSIEENYNIIKSVYSQIEPYKKRLAGKLSGGMKQKLALSCALIHNPKILILDEPTTGVDAVSRKEFWELLHELKEHGMTIIVSTPYMDEAAKCDEVALIHKGKILDRDKPEKMISGYSRQLLSINSKDTHKLIYDLRAYDENADAYLFGHDIHFSTNEQTNFDEMKTYLESKGHNDIEIQQIKASIEDIFISSIEMFEQGKATI